VRTKLEVRSFIRSWDNRGTEKIWSVPGYAHAPFSPKFFIGFCSDGPCENTCQKVCIALPVPEIIRGTQKIWAVQISRSRYAHALFSAKCFMGLCSDGPMNVFQ